MFPKTLGPAAARLLTTLAGQAKTIFTIAEAQAVLDSSYGATLQLVRRLTSAGWLVRLTAGRYVIVPLSASGESIPESNRYAIARELIGGIRYFVSHESAMDIHNMLTRPVTTVTVTTTRRVASREILGIPYRFVTARPDSMWGHTPYEQVEVSDLERTLLDGLARPDLCGGVSEAAAALWNRKDDFDWEKLDEYTRRLGNHAVAKRLGYLLELYHLGNEPVIRTLQGMIGASYAPLDPLLPANGRHIARWRLQLNVEPETLQSIVRT